jgi:hypothetical protein
MRPSNRIEELESQLAEAVLTIRRLRDENERLHVRLGDDRFEPTEGPANLPVSSAIAEGGYLMTGNRKRNRLVASVLARVGLMVLVGAVVFVETYRTIQGHKDGAFGPINPLVVSPLVVLGIATAGVGLWVLLTGRRLRDWPHWPFEGRALRLAGAYCLVGALLVVALAVTRNDGFAFMLYALLALALAATTQVVRSRRPGI